MIDDITKIALEAGELIMPFWRGDMGLRQKEDQSPVTLADERAEAHIIMCLKKLAPSLSIIAEEATSRGEIERLDDRIFYVDPLDGTKEFIHGRSEFTVNIAVVDKGIPIMGIVYAPALGLAYRGSDEGAYRHEIEDFSVKNKVPISAKCPDINKGLIVVGSSSHEGEDTKDFLKQFQIRSYKKAGSSLKFCQLAEGKAHIYPRLGRTMMWDTAAGQAVLSAAGGSVTLIDGLTNLDYRPETKCGPDQFANPYFLGLCQDLELACVKQY